MSLSPCAACRHAAAALDRRLKDATVKVSRRSHFVPLPTARPCPPLPATTIRLLRVPRRAWSGSSGAALAPAPSTLLRARSMSDKAPAARRQPEGGGAASAAMAARASRYTLRSLLMPLPPALNARMHEAGRAAAAVDTTAGSGAASTAGNSVRPASASAVASSSPPLALRCDWTITLQPTTATRPSPPVCLPLLVDLLQFVWGAFPFPTAQAALDGLAGVMAVLPKLSERSPARRESMPAIDSVHVKAEVVSMDSEDAPSSSAALPTRPPLTLSSHRRSAECRMLGQDTLNSWGDVDVILEVPSPTPDNGSTVAPETVASPVADASATLPASSSSTVAEDGAELSAGLYCLNLLPGASIPLHIHRRMTESELMLPAISGDGDGLESQGLPVQRGAIHRWPLNFPHFYRNRSATTVQRILCIDVPRFTRDLEILMEEPQQHLPLALPPRGMRGEEILRDRWTPSALQQASTSFEFPGGLASQTVMLRTDPSQWVQAHAVLVFVFGPSPSPAAALVDASAPPSLLFVHHRHRGWELPGGKIDPGETAEDAAAREVSEEAAQDLEGGSLRMLAQYTIEEQGKPKHVKSVFMARARAAVVRSTNEAAETEGLKLETDAAAFIAPPPAWEAMFAESEESPAASPTSHSTSTRRRYSSILNDNVYPICLKMAMAALSHTVTTDTKSVSS